MLKFGSHLILSLMKSYLSCHWALNVVLGLDFGTWAWALDVIIG